MLSHQYKVYSASSAKSGTTVCPSLSGTTPKRNCKLKSVQLKLRGKIACLWRGWLRSLRASRKAHWSMIWCQMLDKKALQVEQVWHLPIIESLQVIRLQVLAIIRVLQRSKATLTLVHTGISSAISTNRTSNFWSAYKTQDRRMTLKNGKLKGLSK